MNWKEQKFRKNFKHEFQGNFMTCYFRHLEGVFSKAEITVTNRNRKRLDMIIHKMAGVNYKNCALTWKQVKNLLREDEACFIAELKRRWTETNLTVDIQEQEETRKPLWTH